MSRSSNCIAQLSQYFHKLAARGVDFLYVPDNYYDDDDRVGEIDEDRAIRELILTIETMRIPLHYLLNQCLTDLQ